MLCAYFVAIKNVHRPLYNVYINIVAVVVYFITNKVTDAEADLRPYAEKIFDMSGGDQTSETDKPKARYIT